MSSLSDILQDNGAFSTTKIQAHLKLLRMFCAIYDVYSSQHFLHAMRNKPWTPEMAADQLLYYLRISQYRYQLYLKLLMGVLDRPKNTWPVPDWDVAMMMHTHMLSPANFREDMSKPFYQRLLGVLDLPLLQLQAKMDQIGQPYRDADAVEWINRFPGRPYSMMMYVGGMGDGFPPKMLWNYAWMPQTFMKSKPNPQVKLSMNLPEACMRQMVFAKKITAIFPYDPVPESLLLDSQQRYAKFMNLIRLNAIESPVPALDIDLVWHTHQISSSNYMPWCVRHIGREINHDDTVEGGDLATGLNGTKDAWQETYGTDYLKPSAAGTVSEAERPREPSTADKTPPPNLTFAQRALWDFDVGRQMDHEKMAFEFSNLNNILALANEELARAPPPAVHAAASSGGGFMTRLLKVAVADTKPLRDLQMRASFAAEQVAEMHIRHSQRREAWGRQRWPLLCAARSWGDPRVTEGQVARPPQGTREVDFPMYPATWYDLKPLGYYDYFSSGAGGAIFGGGARLGGGMCAGKFDGGLCVAKPVTYYSGSGESGGGT